jgi:hypothetical protein
MKFVAMIMESPSITDMYARYHEVTGLAQIYEQESGMNHWSKLMMPGAFNRHQRSIYYCEGIRRSGRREKW